MWADIRCEVCRWAHRTQKQLGASFFKKLCFAVFKKKQKPNRKRFLAVLHCLMSYFVSLDARLFPFVVIRFEHFIFQVLAFNQLSGIYTHSLI